MAYLAQILLALSLSEPLEPRVTWVFAKKSCMPCVHHQLDLMKDFYYDGDTLLLLLDGVAADRSTEVEVAVRQAFPHVEVVKSKRDFHGIRTGWLWFDDYTGEGVSYNSAGGGYNPMRSGGMLRLVRAPKPLEN